MATANDNKSTTMTEGRALLTERERDAIAGETSDSYRYKTRSYVRNRLDALQDDVDVLAEHDPELLEDLQAVVCTATDTERRESPAAREDDLADQSPGAPEERDDAATGGLDDPTDDSDELAAVRRAADDPDTDALPTTVDEADAADAVRAAVEYLRDEGPAGKGELIVSVMPDYPLDYDADAEVEKVETPGERARGAWWRRVVKPALGEHPAVEHRGGHGDYRYVGASEGDR